MQNAWLSTATGYLIGYQLTDRSGQWKAHRTDFTHLIRLLDKARLPGSSRLPRKRNGYLVADKGYDSDVLRLFCKRYDKLAISSKRRVTLPYIEPCVKAHFSEVFDASLVRI